MKCSFRRTAFSTTRLFLPLVSRRVLFINVGINTSIMLYLLQYAVTHPGRLALLVSVELPSLHMHKVSVVYIIKRVILCIFNWLSSFLLFWRTINSVNSVTR